MSNFNICPCCIKSATKPISLALNHLGRLSREEIEEKLTTLKKYIVCMTGQKYYQNCKKLALVYRKGYCQFLLHVVDIYEAEWISLNRAMPLSWFSEEQPAKVVEIKLDNCPCCPGKGPKNGSYQILEVTETGRVQY